MKNARTTTMELIWDEFDELQNMQWCLHNMSERIEHDLRLLREEINICDSEYLKEPPDEAAKKMYHARDSLEKIMSQVDGQANLEQASQSMMVARKLLKEKRRGGQ